MTLMTKSLLLVLLLSYSSIRVYGFNQKDIWVGGSIIINIYCPDEIKGGEVIKIDIEVRILTDIIIEYFNIKVVQFYETLYSETLWQNQNLGKDFKYVDTLFINTKETFWAENLEFIIDSKHSDIYWVYTSSPSLIISVVRPQTYSEVEQAYDTLNLNYSILMDDYDSLYWDYYNLNWSYSNLNSTYYQLNDDYWNLYNKYDSLNWNMSFLQTTLNSTREKLDNTRYNLDLAYGQIVTWQTTTAVAFVAGLITMYVIGKRRVPRNLVEMKKGKEGKE